MDSPRQCRRLVRLARRAGARRAAARRRIGRIISISFASIPTASRSCSRATVSRWMLYIAAFLPHPTLIVARDQYDRIGLYDAELRIASDHDLILRMIRYFPPKHIPMVLSNMDQTGVSARALSTSLDEFTQVTIRHGVPTAVARAIKWLKSHWWGLRSSEPVSRNANRWRSHLRADLGGAVHGQLPFRRGRRLGHVPVPHEVLAGRTSHDRG